MRLVKLLVASVLLGATFLLAPVHVPAPLADYGERFLAVLCDAKVGIFEVEPLIIWNEELDVLLPELRERGGRAESGDYLLYDFKMLGSRIESTCEIQGSEYRVLVDNQYDSTLRLFENGQQVTSLDVGDVWDFYGYVFKIRHTLDEGWQEACGREESLLEWQPLNPKRVNTNCRVKK